MTASSRTRILISALELARDEGFDHLTFEALAERAGLTRGGVVYHFRTRDALIEGIATLLLTRWQEAALEALGKPLTEATSAERVAALARPVIEGAILPGELAFMLSGHSEAQRLVAVWDDFYDQWVGAPATLTPTQRVALLAAEGYWSHTAAGAEARSLGDPDTLELIVDLAAGHALRDAGTQGSPS